MEKIKIGIIGLGTVGTGVVKILQKNRELIQNRLGACIEIVRIADLDIVSDRGIAIDSSHLTVDAYAIINDPQISIIVELMGGEEPAATFLLRAIEQGKHVVTANKALLSTRGAEIFKAAYDHNVEIGFEGSVCGGIPLIRALKEGLVANKITSIFGILNGTANYVLTRMTEEGKEFDEVLAEAKKLGYAEAEPSLDVNGIDTTHKLSILLSLVYGKKITPDEIYTEGITRVRPLDIEFAKELGYRIKLLAIFKEENGEIAQPWRFVVVESSEFRQRLVQTALPMWKGFFENIKDKDPDNYKKVMKLYEAMDEPKDPIYYSAPIILFVIGPADNPNPISCALACENIMLAAYSLGLGSCYVGFGSMVKGNSEVAQALELKDNERIYGPILLGYPKDMPEADALRWKKKGPTVKWI